MNTFPDSAPRKENTDFLNKELMAEYSVLDDLLRGFDENRLDAGKELAATREDLINKVRSLLSFENEDSVLNRRKLLIRGGAILGGAAIGSSSLFTLAKVREAIKKLTPGSITTKSSVIGGVVGGVAGDEFFRRVIAPRIRPSAQAILIAVSRRFSEIDELVQFMSEHSNLRLGPNTEERLESLVLILVTVINVIDLEDKISISNKK